MTEIYSNLNKNSTDTAATNIDLSSASVCVKHEHEKWSERTLVIVECEPGLWRLQDLHYTNSIYSRDRDRPYCTNSRAASWRRCA